jgi:hypothetical protein
MRLSHTSSRSAGGAGLTAGGTAALLPHNQVFWRCSSCNEQQQHNKLWVRQEHLVHNVRRVVSTFTVCENTQRAGCCPPAVMK